MKRFLSPLVVLVLTSLAVLPRAAAIGTPAYVDFSGEHPDSFPLVVGGHAAELLVDAQELPGVTRAAHDLQADIERVSGVRPPIAVAANEARLVVIVGTVDHNRLIQSLMAAGKLDVSKIRGKWESWARTVVDHPATGIERALVIVGSDKRGAIFGIYDLSEQIGVSPWYWWADVVPAHHDTLLVRAAPFVQGPPSVRYRGIFLNDEYPDLTNWVQAKFGNAPTRQNPPVPPGIANYGHEFYARLFEVLLRLRANYLWPAMWNNAFNEDDPANAKLADEYGIVMGTSHQEPMLRAQKEWDRRYLKTLGSWNFTKQPQVLEQFWREGIARNRDYESLITVGLRGANDTEMAPGGPAANRALLERIVDVQRDILAQETGRPAASVPQLWCLYKEVQDYYEAGMRVPDDVTLLWAEDNWGNVRRLPTAAETKRSGGAGIYYHFDYHGGPRSYQWINTSPLPKIWDQMSLAHAYGANRIWIVNVGHFKGYEIPTEYFLSLAYDTSRWSAENSNDFLRAWAQREFGAAHATEIASIVARYAKYNGRRKPEMLSPSTYSLTDYREAETVVADFDATTAAAEKIFADMPASKRDAFYELVLFPTKASALVNEIYLAAARNELYAQQGRASANVWKAQVEKLFQSDLALMAYYNHDFADGRWAHFMDQTHIGYTTWRDPPKNSLDGIRLETVTPPAHGALGVAVEGSRANWPGTRATARLPRFDSLNRQRRFIEVFNRGQSAVHYTIKASDPWVQVDRTDGDLGPDTRLWINIDWTKAPVGRSTTHLVVAAEGTAVPVEVETLRIDEVSAATLHGFAEDSGYVAMEAEHFTAKHDGADRRWIRIADYGRTLSGMRAEAPPHAKSLPVGPKAARLDYRFYAPDTGTVDVLAITSPTLNFDPDHGLSYGVSIDDEAPQTVTLVPRGYRAQNGNPDWERVVGDNARYSHSKHTIARSGYHTLTLWMVDPGVLVQKVAVDFGGLKPSYLGPPETLRAP